MKLVTFQDSQLSARVGAVVGDRIIDLSEAIEALDFMPAQRAALTVRGLSHLSGMLRLLWTGQAGLATIARTAAERSTNARKHGRLLSEAQLLAPVPRPGKIVAIGRNYADHAKETGVQPFEKPRIRSRRPQHALIDHRKVVRGRWSAERPSERLAEGRIRSAKGTRLDRDPEYRC